MFCNKFHAVTKTIPNAQKYYETDWNISLGSNGVDWLRSLRKIPTWLCGMNFCKNCTSSPHFIPSLMNYETLTNAPKHYETHQNMSLGSNGADSVRSLWKIPMWLRGMNFCINCTSSARFAPSLVQYWNNPKCNKHCETHQGMSLGSIGVDRVRS